MLLLAWLEEDNDDDDNEQFKNQLNGGRALLSWLPFAATYFAAAIHGDNS
jgi:hypothetical protein